jgi:iron complex outermembrane receptor protein
MKILTLAFSMLMHQSSSSADLLSVMQDVEVSVNERTTSGATKRVESSLSSPAIVKSYTQKDLKRFNSLVEFLQYVPGVAVDRGRRNYQYIQVRGLDHQIYNNKVLVLINGHKIADEIGPETNLDLVPIESIRRLEIIRGPGSVLYGSNAFAALISIHTFDALSFKQNEILLTLGNDNQKTTFMDLKDNAKSGPKTYFAYKYSDEKGANHPITENLVMNGQGITAPWALPTPPENPPGTFQPNDHRFVFSDVGNYTLANQVGSFLGVIHAGDLRLTLGKANISRNLSYDFRSDEHQVGLQHFYEYLGGDFEHQLTDKLMWNVRAKYAQTRVLTSERGFDLLDPTNPEFQAISNSYAHDLEMQWTYKPNSKIDWIFGGISESIKYNRTLDLEFINGFAIGFPLTSPTNTSINGLYLQGTIRLNERLELLGAFRRNHNSHYGATYTPKFALSYELNRDEYLKAVWGKAFRYPSGHESFTQIPGDLNPNPNLREEQIESFEFDYVRSMDEGRKRLELTYFRLKIDDFIFQNDRVDRHENSTPLVSEGLEMDLSSKIRDDLKFWLNATVMDLKGETYIYDDGSPDLFGRERFGDFTQSTLKRFGSMGLDWDVNERWDLSLATRYRGSQRNRGDNRYQYHPQGSHFIHDLGINYSHSRDREMRLDIYNLTEKIYRPIDYDIQSVKAQSYPAGRSIRFTYSIKF